MTAPLTHPDPEVRSELTYSAVQRETLRVLHSPHDKLAEKFAAIDALVDFGRAQRAARSREEVLRDTIAHHKAAMARVLTAHRDRRRWLKLVEADNPGVSRFYRLDPHGALASARRHRIDIMAARAELAALGAA